MNLLDGKATSAAIKEVLKEQVDKLIESGNRKPHLAAILVGDDGASITYVNAKVKACEKVGFESSLIRLEHSTSEEELLSKVHQLNEDEGIDGFIVQLPLPDHIDEKKITLAIKPSKDVDGFHPENIGRMSLDLPCFLPATPNGIIELLKHYNVPTEGKNCLIIGRSAIVGTPMSILLSRNKEPGNCTVTMAHSRTQNMESLAKEADILVAAIGKPNFVTADMVKEGATVIDVGINRVEDASKKSGYRLLGDVDFESVSKKVNYITPVPGGVGPMTIASLLQNTLLAYNNKIEGEYV